MKLIYSQDSDLIECATELFNGFKGVKLENAKSILGEEQFRKMMANRTKSKGPKEGTIYPWNVRDFYMR